jgi:hypothetical protein
MTHRRAGRRTSKPLGARLSDEGDGAFHRQWMCPPTQTTQSRPWSHSSAPKSSGKAAPGRPRFGSSQLPPLLFGAVPLPHMTAQTTVRRPRRHATVRPAPLQTCRRWGRADRPESSRAYPTATRTRPHTLASTCTSPATDMINP